MPEETFDLETALAETSVENEQVADVQEAETNSNPPQVETDVSQETSGKTEKDSYYADMRRKQELDDIRQQNATLQAQLNRTLSGLQNFFDGDDIDTLTDALLRQAKGVDVDTIRAERESDSKTRSLERELNAYRQAEVERQMADDLKAIQKIDPSVTSLNDLPKTFLAMRFNETAPMSATERFLATRQIEKQTRTPKPISTGTMTGTGKSENEFFSSSELDRLTSKDLDDPRIFEKAMRSMSRLK